MDGVVRGEHLKRLLRHVLAALVVAYVLVGVAFTLLLAVASWNAREDANCDWPGVPFEAMDGCRWGVAMAAWGQQ